MSGNRNSPTFENNYEDDFNNLDEFPGDIDEDEVLVSHTNIFQKQPAYRIPAYERQQPTPQTIYGSQRFNQNRLNGVKGSSKASGAYNIKERIKPSAENPTTRKNPRISSLRTVAKNEFQRTAAKDHMAERVLSAKARRVHDLENERNLLRIQADNLKQEVKTLNLMLRRQGRALGQYENKDEKFPTLLQQAEEEARIVREHLRNAKQKYAQLREQYRQLESYSQTTEKERDRLAAIVRDKQLLDSKALKQERDNLSKHVEASEQLLKDAHRRTANLQRKHAQERQLFDLRVRELIRRQEGLEAENFVIKHRLVQLGHAVPDPVPEPRSRRLENRSHSHDAERSRSATHQRSSSREITTEPEEKKLQSLETRIFRNAKPSFLKEFKYATGTIPENPLSGHESPMSSELISTDVGMTPNGNEQQNVEQEIQRHTNQNFRKTRMSPDLLKDHSDRAREREFDQSPSVQNSRESPQDSNSSAVLNAKEVGYAQDSRTRHEISWHDGREFRDSVDNGAKVTTYSSTLPAVNQSMAPKDENTMSRSDLLEKIRQLDLAKRDIFSGGDSVRTEQGPGKPSLPADNSSLPRRNGLANDPVLIDELSHGDAPISSSYNKSSKSSYKSSPVSKQRYFEKFPYLTLLSSSNSPLMRHRNLKTKLPKVTSPLQIYEFDVQEGFHVIPLWW